MFFWIALTLLQAADDAPSAPVDANSDPATYETKVHAQPNNDKPAGRAQSTVHQSDLDRRLPRSAPDALRYEPGVFVQQTAHGQGSTFIRGLTGQQTLLIFDGIRLNNSTYRQGPNQYFFTLDAQTIAFIEVLRGGSSTYYGSDALGGVVLTHPIEPQFNDHEVHLTPQLRLSSTTADAQRGGRAQLNVQINDKLALLAGVGSRRVALLKSAGNVRSPESGQPAEVPRFDADGRTQLGTGFDELTGDLRAVWRLSESDRLTLAAYVYNQYDAPRTDQCPPVGARFDECLNYDEQFRWLSYAALEMNRGSWLRDFRATLSWQRQHERRTLNRPASFVRSSGRDDVDSFGVTMKAHSEMLSFADFAMLFNYGADTYLDHVDSNAWLSFSDIGITQQLSRGQYVKGSRYLYGGVFLDAELHAAERLIWRNGARLSWSQAKVPQDQRSATTSVKAQWLPWAAHSGLELAATDFLTLLLNVDFSFRSPNIDDLSSRQQTGPGFQFENPYLSPERASTADIGARLKTENISAELWFFQTWLQNAVVKAPREITQCPPESSACGASWFRYQLVNAPGYSLVRGTEASLRLRLPWSLSLRSTLNWTWGDSPNVASNTGRIPLSRIPPLNGTIEGVWRHESGLQIGSALRYALAQTRLAIADRSDGRIPQGGTPGFWVHDFFASYRWDSFFTSILVENIFDSVYRYHGSSINGAQRGLRFVLGYEPGVAG